MQLCKITFIVPQFRLKYFKLQNVFFFFRMVHCIPSSFEPHLLYYKYIVTYLYNTFNVEISWFGYTLKIFLHLFIWGGRWRFGNYLPIYWKGKVGSVIVPCGGLRRAWWSQSFFSFHVRLRDWTQVVKVALTCTIIVKQFSNVT